MKKHLEKWVALIDDGSVDEFATSFSSYFAHLHALLDLYVPVSTSDTTICTITAQDSELALDYTYQTTKFIHEDSTITYFYTDKVENSNSLVKQAMSYIVGSAAEASPTKDTNNTVLRLASMQDEDKSEITIDNDGTLLSYFRIRTSSRLDAELREERSFYNFEIRVIENNDKE